MRLHVSKIDSLLFIGRNGGNVFTGSLFVCLFDKLDISKVRDRFQWDFTGGWVSFGPRNKCQTFENFPAATQQRFVGRTLWTIVISCDSTQNVKHFHNIRRFKTLNTGTTKAKQFFSSASQRQYTRDSCFSYKFKIRFSVRLVSLRVRIPLFVSESQNQLRQVTLKKSV